MFACSPQVFYGWRNLLLRLFGANIGHGVRIRPTAKVTYPWKVTLGDHVGVGDNAVLYSLAEITVGANTQISQKAYICAATHDYLQPTFPLVPSPIVIGEQAWIAADVFVAPGVKIADGAIVGARSTVLRDVEPQTIVAGYPAKFIKMRFS